MTTRNEQTMRCHPIGAAIPTLFALALLTAVLVGAQAQAATFNVASGDSAGLITDIASANSNGDAANTVNLAAGSLYTLNAVNNTNGFYGANGLPELVGGKSLTINGNGSEITRASGSPAFRFFGIQNNAAGTVIALNDLTVTNGSAGTDNGGGICVYDGGGTALNMTNCRVAGCTGAVGGGIMADRTDLTLNRCMIENNTCTSNNSGGGGLAIIMQSAGWVWIVTDCTFRNNTVTGNNGTGGGVYIAMNGYTGPLSFNFTRCTISGNSLTGGGTCRGGGIALGVGIGGATPRMLNLTNCTITGNSVASGSGGGVSNLANSGYDYGSYTAQTNLSSCTITGNSASVSGGGFYNEANDQVGNPNGIANVTVANSIVAGNSAPAGPDGHNNQVAGATYLTSNGYNMIGDNSTIAGWFPAGAPNANNDFVNNVRLNLGPLANNGGLTETMALLAGSTAKGNGDPSLVGATDQRNVVRHVPVAIGAFQDVPLAQFALALSSPQTNGVAFTGVNTLTAQDAGGNTVTTFDASLDNVRITANSPLVGNVAGLGTGINNVLNRPTDFVAGVADLAALGMIYGGGLGTGTFTATSSTGKTGVSGMVTINDTGPGQPGKEMQVVMWLTIPASVSIAWGAGTTGKTAGDVTPLDWTVRDAGGNLLGLAETCASNDAHNSVAMNLENTSNTGTKARVSAAVASTGGWNIAGAPATDTFAIRAQMGTNPEAALTATAQELTGTATLAKGADQPLVMAVMTPTDITRDAGVQKTIFVVLTAAPE